MQEDSVPTDPSRVFEPLRNVEDSARNTKPLKAKQSNKKSIHLGHFQFKGAINLSNVAEPVHIGHTIVIDSKEGEKLDDKEDCDLPDLSNITGAVTTQMLNEVTRGVGSTWKELGRHLGLLDSTLDQLYMDHHQYGVSEVIYQMLQTWEQEQSTNASVGQLAAALTKAHCRDGLLILQDYIKEQQANKIL